MSTAALLALLGSQERVGEAIRIGIRYGQIDGAHHKTWVIDQMIRALAGDSYDAIIRAANINDEDPGDPYEWDTGCAP